MGLVVVFVAMATFSCLLYRNREFPFLSTVATEHDKIASQADALLLNTRGLIFLALMQPLFPMPG